MKAQDAIRVLGKTNLCTPIGQAAFVGIEAIKKQIPKSIIKTEMCSQACPVCKSPVNQNYCGGCGQRIRHALTDD